MNKQTAILIFAQTAKRESQSKPFKDSELLFETLNANAIKIASKTKLSFFHFSEANQIGNNFGERFIYAINQVFDMGYTNVITIGNDSPHLSVKHILKAEKELKNGRAVFGPSLDGGFYLMGINSTQFNANRFLTLPWQTSQLLVKIIHLIETNTSTITCLEYLADLDKADDLKQVLDSFKTVSAAIKKLIIGIFKVVKLSFGCILLIEIKQFPKKQFNKGSPQLLHL